MSNDAFDPRAFLADFLTEANEHLATLDDMMLETERLVADGQPLDDALVNGLFRAIHTLKGMAGMMGFSTFTSLAHDMEQVVDEVRRGERRLALGEVSVLFEGLDALKRCNERVAAAGHEEGVELGGVPAAISALAAGAPVPASPSGGPAEDLLGRVDPHEQMAALVAVAKGATMYQLEVRIGPDCGDVGPEDWRAGLDLVGTVLGSWLPDASEVARETWAALDATARVTVLLVTEADRQSVLDCTGVPETSLVASPLPWQQGTVKPSPAPAAKPLVPVASPPAEPRPAPALTASPVMVPEKATSIRVETERLDHLMELVGELVIHHTRLAQLTSQLNDLAAGSMPEADRRQRLDDLAGELEEAMQVVGRVSEELQENTMKIRMVPVRALFNRFPRIVRDLAKECGKSARLELIGADTELDKTVIEQIGDPLIHLLRNGLDHGLESPAERLEHGKPVEGVITLAASQEGHNIVIVVADDGHGIDRGRVLAKARERKLIGEHETLTEQEIFQLIFRPGFSTAEKVTNISGRGVGMDVVQQNIQRLGGSIQVLSEVGRGTRFVIKLPLTLAIAKALLVRAGGHTFATPLAAVEETLRLMPDEIKTVHEQEVLQVRGSVLPIFRLNRLFDMPSALEPHQPLPVVIVSDGERRLGLAVDSLIGQQDVVVKNLGDFLGHVPGIGGATILGDGRVALILDVATLLAHQGAVKVPSAAH